MADPDHDNDVHPAEPPRPDTHAATQPPPPPPPRPPALMPLRSLLDLVHGTVVSQVRESTVQALEHLLARYCPMDPQAGRMVPRAVQIPIPGPHGTPILRDIPLFALANHQDVAVDTVVIRLRTGLVEKTETGGAATLMVDLNAGEGGGNANAEVEIRLRGTPMAEGIARINDTIIKRIGGEER